MNKHRCHWPGCPIEVPPAMWGCKPHWFRLPKGVRNQIWATYRPGQEVDKDPSREYLAAARQAEDFAKSQMCTTVVEGLETTVDVCTTGKEAASK